MLWDLGRHLIWKLLYHGHDPLSRYRKIDSTLESVAVRVPLVKRVLEDLGPRLIHE